MISMGKRTNGGGINCQRSTGEVSFSRGWEEAWAKDQLPMGGGGIQRVGEISFQKVGLNFQI
jgi:hypothetical protein